MFSEKGIFPDGILSEGRILRDFQLQEETFRHTLEVGNDPAIDNDLCNDAAYFSAAVLSKRVTVDGLETVTPQTILDLSGDDGQYLMMLSALLDKRREDFRSQAVGMADGRSADGEAGLPGRAGGEDAPGGDAGDPEGSRGADGAGGRETEA